MPPDLLGRVLLVVWTGAACYELWLFARGYRRNLRRLARLRDIPRAHPGRVMVGRSRLRRDAIFFTIALVALAIALASVAGPPGLVGPAVGIGLTLILVVIGVEGHLSQRDDRYVETFNAPRDRGSAR